MEHRRLAAAMGFPMSLLLFGCTGPPPVSYLKTAEPQQQTAYSSEEAYRSKVDFARLEHELPLSPSDVTQITFRNLQAADQEQLDQIYSRLTAGPIPDGVYNGEFFFPRGESGHRRISEIMGQNLKGVMVNFKMAKLEHLGDAMWRGKVFDKNQKISRSRVQRFSDSEGAGRGGCR